EYFPSVSITNGGDVMTPMLNVCCARLANGNRVASASNSTASPLAGARYAGAWRDDAMIFLLMGFLSQDIACVRLNIGRKRSCWVVALSVPVLGVVVSLYAIETVLCFLLAESLLLQHAAIEAVGAGLYAQSFAFVPKIFGFHVVQCCAADEPSERKQAS